MCGFPPGAKKIWEFAGGAAWAAEFVMVMMILVFVQGCWEAANPLKAANVEFICFPRCKNNFKVPGREGMFAEELPQTTQVCLVWGFISFAQVLELFG